MSKYKDYIYQHQKKRFRLRIYSMGMHAKIFMDDTLRDMSVPNTQQKIMLDYYFRDERNQEHRVHVERKNHWFKFNYLVYYDGQLIYKTLENEPA